MINSKKKAQISIEALIIVGVLVIGGVIFASVYLNNLGVHTKRSSELSGLTDGFMNDLEGWNTPGTPNTPTVNCIIDEVCQDPPENASNCPGDCEIPTDGCNENGFCEASLGETAANCSDCVAPVFSNFTISKFVPAGDSAINSKFSLKAQINSSYPSVEIYDIMLKKYDDSIMEYVISKKCTIKGVAPDTATGIYPGTLLMTIEDVSLKNQGKIIDEITCSEEGEYRFSANARPKNVAGIPPLSAQVSKIITPAPIGCGNTAICESGETCPTCPECCTVLGDIFSVKIAVPENQKYFFREDRTDFIAVLNPEKKAGETDSCVWYVNESKEIPIGSQPDSCRLEGISLNDTSLFAEGLNTITVYAQRSTLAAGKKLEANAKIEINILKPINPGILYLSAPRNLIVGESFNLKVYGITEGQVNATRNISNFTFTGNKCAITSATPVCGSTTVNSTNVYYCDYPAVCSSASYAQTSPYDPSEVVASLQGTSETARFYSEYDLLFDSGNCNKTGTSYGILNVCAHSTGNLNFNSNYWVDNSFGLLKLYVDSPRSEVSNNYGILKAYISE